VNHWSNIKTLEHVDTNGCVYPGTGNRLYEGHFKEQFNMAPEDLSICRDHGWTLLDDDDSEDKTKFEHQFIESALI